jgi:hypothetical protein
MGIIAPKKLGRDRKVFFTLLFIGLSPILVIPCSGPKNLDRFLVFLRG